MTEQPMPPIEFTLCQWSESPCDHLDTCLRAVGSGAGLRLNYDSFPGGDDCPGYLRVFETPAANTPLQVLLATFNGEKVS